MAGKAEARKQQLIKAAFEAATDKGYEHVTLQDIADYAEVSKGVPNYYFKSKGDVFAHLFEWLTQRIFENERAAMDEVETAEEKLQAYIGQVFISPEENRTFYQLYLDFLARVKQEPAYQKINAQFYEHCFSIGRSIVEQGIAEGVYEVEDVEQAAVMIRTMIDGSLLQWLMRGEESLHDWYRDSCHEGIRRMLGAK
ncbi:TetR/AcrR family transcriptional regulator [Halobacillus locisalis]|uniref:TetR/AcrR family transcriptional regulator n=1 Tax=Halobacillus locisalis TaxID=220753 RepID=A0A838CW93_9BACI|nr:TetR/AcrR family transcriptional regulator [Halobacillus locisalis]MBA2176035.1 TetR/AcrR family transcriptional regulator [Halobacillus locisalis]